MADDVIDMNGLDKILKALKGKPPVIRVGIFGSHNARNDKSGLSNSDIGAEHEFGSSKMPRRSFLRVPLSDNLDKKIASSGLITEDSLKQVLKIGSIIPWCKTIAQIAESVVQDAFNSNGNGQWAPWKNGYTSLTGNILKNTQQLAESISSEVVE